MSSASLSPVAPIAPQEPALSEPQRLMNVFFSPSRTFADIRRNARWWVPWLVLAVFSFAASEALDQKIGYEQITENQIRMIPKAQEQMDKLTPEQQQRQIHARAVGTRWIFGYLSPITGLIFLLLCSAALMATFNFGLGAEVTFKQAMAVTSYGLLIRAVHAVLLIGAALASSDPSTFNISNPVATNPAFFLSFADTPKFLYSLLSNIDIIVIWTYVVLGIGFAVVAKKKVSTGIKVMAGWFAFWTLLFAGIAAAFAG